MPTATREVQPADDNLDKLFKLLPAEVTGAFIGIRTLIDTATNANDRFLFFFAFLILVLSPFLYWFALNVRNLGQIFFLMFSYIVWAANIDIMRINAYRTSEGSNSQIVQFVLDPIFIKGLLIIWVLMLVPLILKKEPG